MLPELTITQWAVLAGAAALVLLPRAGALRGPIAWFAGLLRRQPASPDVHAKVDAYQTLVTDLSPELATQVWAAVQWPVPPPPPPEESHAPETH